ncbi:MAG TPA: hypothetical protein VK644_10950, partial [Chitinophagaceae bacterium]|nr:hypothetical protein [Chitinophagaceae bacterium]
MYLRKFKKIVLWVFLSLLFLVMAAWIFIQTPFGQNYIIGKVTARLSKDLKTRVDIKHIDFSLFNKLHLEGTLVEDRKGDTLLYAGDLNVRLTDWFFFNKNIELKYIGLKNAVMRIERTDSTWNHQFLLDYFSSPSSGSGDKKEGTQLNLKQISLEHVTFYQIDKWKGHNMMLALGSLNLEAKDINFAKKTIDLNVLTIVSPYVSLFDYQGTKPPRAMDEKDKTAPLIDSTLKWNAEGWIVKAAKLDIQDGTFKTDRADTAAVHSYFDGKHIEFSKIYTHFTDLRWEKDTVTAHINLQTKERSGFEVKNMIADLKLTPQEMAFDKLDIKTNNSTIRNYFRMNYDDFTSMNDFIHAVKMQANFDNAEIDSDDIAYFAPGMKSWKKALRLKGSARGTVDDLVGKDLVILAGNNTLLNGDISMTGLPDINQTFIDFKANDFRTTYDDAAAFVPAIRTITKPNLRKLQYIKFKGSFTGFIRDFVTFGTIQTNLGSITSDINMKLPSKQQPVYSGTISTDYFRLGELIGDDEIGAVSLNGSIKGRGFDEKTRQTDIDGKINFADYKDYRYNNITLKGKLDRKKFNGT